jgi:intracellular multiplication protein IcmG
MDDKTISSPNDAEYNFTDSEGAPEAVPEAGVVPEDSPDQQLVDSEASGFSIKNINLRRFIKPILILLVILFIYGIFSFYSARKTRSVEQKRAAAQEVVNTQQDMISMQAPVAPPPAITTQLSPSLNSEQIEQINAAVQQKLSEIAQDVSKDTAQVAVLEDSISKSQQDIYDIGKNVNQLTIAMQQVLVEMQKLKAPPKVKPKKKLSKPVVYHIRAIVPGRVWIESAKGKSVTLRVGDRLDGYGTVEVISPRQGMVVMSNGSYIQYGVNDF